MGWTYAQAGWLNTANALGYLAGAVLTMLLIRRFSPARQFSVGMVTTTLALLATGLDAAPGWQTFWRFAVGLLGALSFSTAGPYGAGLVGDWFGNIGISLLAAAGVLLVGAALALLQRPLQQSTQPAR
jgi:MFS family permease